MSTEDWKRVLEAVGALLGVAVTAGIVIKVTSNRSSKNTKTIQKNITTGGDNAGRDINKK